MTAVQEEVANRLVAADIYVYTDKVQGKGIVAAWRRYLESGDTGKITPALYHFISMKCGYIAHYDLNGFRHVYADPAQMLKGELYATVWEAGGYGGPVEHSASVYTDGMTDQDVYKQMVLIAEELRVMVFQRSATNLAANELVLAEHLARKHGFALTPK